MIKKIIILVLVLAIPLTLSAFPGDKGGFEGHHANRVEHLTKKLDLTTEQKTKVDALFKAQDEKFQNHP
jgi:periplasmic protein CpxP/Spy